MDEHSVTTLQERSEALFDASVDHVDMRIRSRLTQARHAALAAAASPQRRFLRAPWWAVAVGATAACALGVTIWFGSWSGRPAASAGEQRPSFEDLDLIAATDEGSGDTMEMLQDDVAFYAWAADKTARADSGHTGHTG